MDILFVKELKLSAIIGCLPWERKVKQHLLLSLELRTDAKAISLKDDLAGAFDYAHITTRIEAFVAQSACRLIETLAEQIAELLQTEFSVRGLRLTLEKPGALPGANTVGITLERGFS